MICVRVTRREGGATVTALGHAGYAPRGQDIVCAGVSAILFSLIAYLRGTPLIATAEACGGERPRLRVEEGDGRLVVEIVGSSSCYGEALGMAIAGLSLMATRYPAHVTLDTNEKGDEYESN